MSAKLQLNADDKGAYFVDVNFYDENGAEVVPNSITWSLTNGDNTVINSREDVSVSSPASTIHIVLSEDDLKYSDGPRRVLVIKARYDSTLGSNLPLNGQADFYIDDIYNIT